MATTARGIYYPVVGDVMTPLANRFASLASSVDTALGNIKQAASYTGTNAERTAMTAGTGLREGITFYTTDTDLMYLYNGAAWVVWQRQAAPFATAAGFVNTPSSGYATVNFPAGRFTQIPTVTASGGTQGIVGVPRIISVTTSSFQIAVWDLGGIQRGATAVTWQAIQMTSASASG